MRLLILGGTSFVGRHLAACALARGHAVTLFHRGRTGPGLFPQAEHLLGDRDGGLGVLAGRRWEAAIDVSGYVPRLVADAARALSDAVDRYVLISSIAAYRDHARAGLCETDALAPPPAPEIEAVRWETYGPLKAACEAAVEAALPGRTLIIRPGLVAGPYDPTDRLTAWAHRARRGGAVLAPAPAEAPVQVIDARDLADWTLQQIEARATGVFNAVGPAGLTLGELIAHGAALAGVEARPVWVEPAWLESGGVALQRAFPCVMPPAMEGLNRVDGSRAVAAGLRHRPLEATLADTLAWFDGEGRAPVVGLAPAEEQALQAAWARR